MTTNNHTGEEPRTVALEKQVQTLVEAVERLTKQNHNLEEQLHQKDVGSNSHGEEQEGTSAKMRDRKGPEGSHALSRQSNKIPAVCPP